MLAGVGPIVSFLINDKDANNKLSKKACSNWGFQLFLEANIILKNIERMRNIVLIVLIECTQ